VTALLCINLVVVELVLCVVVSKAAGSRDDGGWSMVGKTSLRRVQPCGKTINTCMNTLKGGYCSSVVVVWYLLKASVIARIISFSSIWDMHSLSSGCVEGEVSSIDAFPVMVRIK
jgi:hypothetical protein